MDSPEPETARLNGRDVEIRPGDTILSAARRLGIDVPTLCHDDRFSPEGGCRICVVHSAGHDLPLAACHTRLIPGMEIQTHHVAVEKLRRSLMNLFGQSASTTGFRGTAPGGGNGGFEELAALYLSTDAMVSKASAVAADRSHPMIHFTGDACIGCRLCLKACDQIEGAFVFGINGRGAALRLSVSGGRSVVESPCTACGSCVDLCPTGAISDRDRRKAVPREAERTVVGSVCGYCSVGCRMEIHAAGDAIQEIEGIKGAATNQGSLCQKGRFGHSFQGSWDRLSQPMLRQGAGFREVSWDEAFAFTAGRIQQIVSESGPDSFGALASTRATNESNYLLQKFCRAVIGTNNIDSSARLCHQASVDALRLVTGIGAASASFDDLEKASCIVIAGANPDDSHPVLAARIRQAVRFGARLIVIDPRRTWLADFADVFLQPQPGTDVAVFHAIAAALLDSGACARDFLDGRVENLESFSSFVGDFPLKGVAGFSGLEANDILAAANLIGESAGRVLFVPGAGLTQQFHGTGSVLSFLNLAILTGSFDRPGAGFLPPGGQNNLQGCIDSGCLPDRLPGQVSLDNAMAQQRFSEAFGTPVPDSAGLHSGEMIEAAATGEMRSLWVVGHDIRHCHPMEERVVEALDKLDFLIVQDLFYSDLCRHADIILPAAAFLEQSGTFTNSERRVQRVRPAVAAPGEARPDWAIIQLVARNLGVNWPYQDAGDVFSEMAGTVPEHFGGIDYSRLDSEPDGIQWPCPSPEHPGTRNIPALPRLTLSEIDVPLSFEHGVEEFPYLLITGRRLEHHGGGSMTRRNASRYLSDHDVIEIHSSDAGRDGFGNGDRVRVESRYGSGEMTLKHSGRILPGTAFLSIHFPQTHANRLVGPVTDPESHCPQFKATAVRIAATEE